MSYNEALGWLYSLQRFGIKLGLENIQRLLADLLPGNVGGPQTVAIAHDGLEAVNPRKVIHVAGTNGKGSVCAMIDSICRAGGLKTGLFISPHLVTFRERIRINGEMISEDAVASGLTKIRDLVRDWDPHPTFFEITTALAWKHFFDAKLDVVVLETGLGGRLDATNAVPSNVAVITPIGFDHEKWLGSTLREIAGEKAGIIKAGTPVVSAAQDREAEEVLRMRAADCDAPLELVSEPYDRSPVALRGAHQKQNAALAVAAIRASKITVGDAAIVRGLMSVKWPARFQSWDDRTIIDGAHNAAAAKILARTWRETFGDQRCTLILAILADKDLRAISEALVPISDFVLLPPMRGERASEPNAIAQVLGNIARTPENASLARTSIAASIGDALEVARAKPNPILVTGSLHFAGEVLAHLQGQPASFEECGQ